MKGKGRADLVRFALFLVIVAGLVAYVAAWRRGLERDRMGRWEEPDAAPPVGMSAPPAADGAAKGGDFFAEFRLERDRARGREREMLRELMTPSTPEEARRQANERYLRLSRLMGLEVELEGLIRSRGFEDAVVFLGDSAAQVVIRAPSLTPVQVAAVADLVHQVAGVDPDRIRIVARER